MVRRIIIDTACGAALCAALFFPSPGLAGQEAGNQPAALIGLTTACADAVALDEPLKHAAAALRADNRLFALKPPPADGTMAGLDHWAALLDAGRKSYFGMKYAEGGRQLADALRGLESAGTTVTDDAKRWAMVESAMAYAALSSLAQGDEKGYREMVARAARLRPTAAYGVTFPPHFRKVFDDAADGASGAAPVPLTIEAKAAAWRVRLDGTDRGRTPLTLKVHEGTHFVGVVRPDGTVRYNEVVVAGTGKTITIDPAEFLSVNADGAAVLCLPSDHEFARDDGIGILPAPAPEVISVYPFKSDLMLVRASAADRAVKASIMVPLADAKHAARMASAVKSLYGSDQAVSRGTPEGAAESKVAEHDDGLLHKWWFWTAAGVVVAAAVGVPLYLFLGDKNGSTLGAVTVKP